jgi:ferredoxin
MAVHAFSLLLFAVALVWLLYIPCDAFYTWNEPRRVYASQKHTRALSMAERRTANAAGNLFVDESCIDCDTCRWMCPSVYRKDGFKSAVYKQPVSDPEKVRRETNASAGL